MSTWYRRAEGEQGNKTAAILRDMKTPTAVKGLAEGSCPRLLDRHYPWNNMGFLYHTFEAYGIL